ncbi:MAG: DUF58 domain-containing protein [Thermodesulfobacteriota bacterium]
METSRTAIPLGAYSELPELIRLRYGARELKLGRQRKVFSQLVGPHQTRFRGRGIEFEEVRAYHPGDDVRSIDWRVTARSGKAHTKLFREERERPVMLLVDQSLSMFFGSRNCFKSVTAAHTGALLAWASLQKNDRVGGLVFNGSDHAEVRPKRSARNVLQLLHSIDDFNHRLHRRLSPAADGLDQALEELRRITRPGSNIFIISDFQGLSGEGIKHLHLLNKHNDISAVRIYDPLEQDLPANGYYSITNGVQRFALYTGDHKLRSRYREIFQEKGDSLLKALGPMGIPLMPLSTLDSPLYYFRELLGAKR